MLYLLFLPLLLYESITQTKSKDQTPEFRFLQIQTNVTSPPPPNIRGTLAPIIPLYKPQQTGHIHKKPDVRKTYPF